MNTIHTPHDARVPDRSVRTTGCRRVACLIPLVLAMTLAGVAQASGTVAGATEPTQVLNKLELIKSHLSQIKSTATEIQQYTNMVVRLQNQVRMMMQLDPAKVRDLLRGVGIATDMAGSLATRFNVSQDLAQTLTSVADSMSVIYREGTIAANVMEDLQAAGYAISGNDYISGMNALARMRVDTYGRRREAVQKASETVLADSERLKRIAELNPEITSEIQGAQATVKMVEFMAGQISYSNQLLGEQLSTQLELNQAQILALDEAHIRQSQNERFFRAWDFSPVTPASGGPPLPASPVSPARSRP